MSDDFMPYEDTRQRQLLCFCENLPAVLSIPDICFWPRTMQEDLRDLIAGVVGFDEFFQHWKNYHTGSDTLFPFLENVKASFENSVKDF